MANKKRGSRKSKAPRTEDLGHFLAEARTKSGLTLVEVAEALGLKSGQSVWDWENGKGSGIPADMLLRLVKLYGISSAKAYDLLIDFHQEKARLKVAKKFEEAKVKLERRQR